MQIHYTIKGQAAPIRCLLSVFKTEEVIKWYKLNREECCEVFRKELGQVLLLPVECSTKIDLLR